MKMNNKYTIQKANLVNIEFSLINKNINVSIHLTLNQKWQYYVGESIILQMVDRINNHSLEKE